MSREQLAFSFDEPSTPQPYTLTCADVLTWAQGYTGEKFSAILCDPPYSLGDGNKGFMNSRWDTSIAFRPETWKALAQHLLPGAFIMAFASSRGFHRVMTAMEDAGLRLYPSIFGWLTGSSFPKATRIDAVLEKQRHDYPAVKQVVLWLREAAAQAGYTAERINDALGWGSAVAHHFLAPSESNAGVPTWEQWLQLKSLLKLSDELDAEVWRLNGRKGQPGEIWAQREVIGVPDRYCAGRKSAIWGADEHQLVTAPATPIAQTWAGHRYGGQMLKNSLEPIIVAQVPYAGKPVQSIVQNGSGALWIDGGRLPTHGETCGGKALYHTEHEGWQRPWKRDPEALAAKQARKDIAAEMFSTTGRWPSNFALSHTPECVQVGTRQVREHKRGVNHVGDSGAFADGPIYGSGPGQHSISPRGYADANGQETVAAWECADQCPVAALDAQAGVRPSGSGNKSPAPHRDNRVFGKGLGYSKNPSIGGDTGSASRFFHVSSWELDVAEQIAQADPAFYCPKASRVERDAGLEGMPLQVGFNKNTSQWKADARHPDGGYLNNLSQVRNPHPTIKPIALCRWLATLLLPPATYAPRRLLNVFAGTGSEAIGALLAGWDEVMLVEQDASYVALAEQRLAYWHRRMAGGV